MPFSDAKQRPGEQRGGPPDADLLRRYADERSEEAFGEVVRRHVNLVYAIALRQCGGDAHLAEDVTQRVFTDLARKARTLSGHGVLSGWLYRSAQFAASDAVRAERRRRAREREAQAMHETASSQLTPGDADWQKLGPVLDQAIGGLSEGDRDAVVLRFVEGRPFADIGAALRLSDNAARMRVERALDKLREALRRRGIASTSAALGLALANQATATLPAGMAASVTTAALAGTAAGAGGTAAAAIFMGAKSQVGIAAALALAGSAGMWWQASTQAGLKAEIEALRREAAQIGTLRAGNTALQRTAAEVAAFRNDDAEFARLRDEAEDLGNRLRAAAEPPRTAVPVAAEGSLPRPKVQTAPAYPLEMQVAGIGGTVQIDMIVDATGRVAQPYVKKSTRPEFEAPSLEAARGWQYEPAMRSGRQVNTHVAIPITFTPGRTTGEIGEPEPVIMPAPKTPDWF